MVKACKTPHFIKPTSREEHHIRTDVDKFRALGKEYDPELFIINLNHHNIGDGLLTVGGVLTVFPYRLPD